jgi:hypothetical protein
MPHSRARPESRHDFGERPGSFRALAVELDEELGLPIVQAKPELLAETDRQCRVFARCQAQNRLDRSAEAVLALNRLIRGPIGPALLSDLLDAAESALQGRAIWRAERGRQQVAAAGGGRRLGYAA